MQICSCQRQAFGEAQALARLPTLRKRQDQVGAAAVRRELAAAPFAQ
jgi:hypothetical protein